MPVFTIEDTKQDTQSEQLSETQPEVAEAKDKKKVVKVTGPLSSVYAQILNSELAIKRTEALEGQKDLIEVDEAEVTYDQEGDMVVYVAEPDTMSDEKLMTTVNGVMAMPAMESFDKIAYLRSSAVGSAKFGLLASALESRGYSLNYTEKGFIASVRNKL